MSVALSLGLTMFQLTWSALWGALHLRIRKGRNYARGREPVGALDGLYRRLTPLLFVAQLGVSVLSLWSASPRLLPFHQLSELRVLGALLLALSLGLTAYAVSHLRDNYSPCYDSHLPPTLISSGPYAFVRHPMYVAKLLAGVGALLLSGSLWLLPSMLYLTVVTWRALRREERDLMARMPGYATYMARTRSLIPYLY